MHLNKRQLYSIIILIIVLTTSSLWYFDLLHKPVEPVGKLLGKDYAFALKYFGAKPNSSTAFNITDDLNEFNGGVLSVDVKLKDSIINQYTWEFNRYKITIWIAETTKSPNEIIDAIRYKNNVRF